MNPYVTGSVIKTLREQKGLTQSQLAEQLGVSDKTVSKWETAKGLPDITLLAPLATALSVSVMELMSGNRVVNQNTSANILRSQFYVCPLCGNVIRAGGCAVISCCGIPLPALEAEAIDQDHAVTLQAVEDEQFLTIDHPMTKDHFISFVAHVTYDRVQLVKFYPEGNAQTRLSPRGGGFLYLFCNKHGLMKMKL